MNSCESTTNAIRSLAIDMVERACSGHPGAPMGLAPMGQVLFGRFLRFDSGAPGWANRDRFVLSNGHASALLYALLHLCGYGDTSAVELARFRQLGSATPGHPEAGATAGVEVTTGPLGQGIANAVGLALAEAHLAAVFNRPGHAVIDHYTYAFCGDGCLMEGVGQEALSLAGHQALDKLIIIYDDNKVTIDGSTELAYTEDTRLKYEAMNFHVITVADGDSDYGAMIKSLEEARAPIGKPKLIRLRTTIGCHAKLEGTAKVHGAPLGKEEIQRLKKAWGRPIDKEFYVEEHEYEVFRTAAANGKAKRIEWEKTMESYKLKYPKDYERYEFYMSTGQHIPDIIRIDDKEIDWKAILPKNNGNVIATRKASENTLASLMNTFPNIIGGSADLTGSNLTRPGSVPIVDHQATSRHGRYLRFGVREHAMAAIINGIHAHGGLLPFGATFLNFIGYALGAVRLSAISHHGCIYVATHDSIGLGEDGPTHQPIELVVSLRATPNMHVWRPADQTETSAAWASAIINRSTPSVLCLSRGTTPCLNTDFDKALNYGAYVILGHTNIQVVIVGTGTELCICIDAANELQASHQLNAQVVSMPCQCIFNKTDLDYKHSVFPPGVPVLSVEPYSSLGWERYSHFHIGMDTFGGSAPASQLYKHFKITCSHIVQTALKLVATFKDNAPTKLYKLI